MGSDEPLGPRAAAVGALPPAAGFEALLAAATTDPTPAIRYFARERSHTPSDPVWWPMAAIALGGRGRRGLARFDAEVPDADDVIGLEGRGAGDPR